MEVIMSFSEFWGLKLLVRFSPHLQKKSLKYLLKIVYFPGSLGLSTRLFPSGLANSVLLRLL